MEKLYTKEQIKKMIGIAMETFISGEDNSWKCTHNLNILLQSIEDSIYLDEHEKRKP